MMCGSCAQEIRPGEPSEPRVWATNTTGGMAGQAHVECPPDDEEE